MWLQQAMGGLFVILWVRWFMSFEAELGLCCFLRITAHPRGCSRRSAHRSSVFDSVHPVHTATVTLSLYPCMCACEGVPRTARHVKYAMMMRMTGSAA